MKIRNIEPIAVRRTTVLKVTADDGLVGWGECGGALTREQMDEVRAIAGSEVYRYDPIRVQLIANPAQGAVNMALLDLIGQASKAPVYQVLGGPTRNKIRAFTDWSEDAGKAGHKAFLTTPDRFAAREGMDFVVDGGGKLTPGQASSLAAKLEKQMPLWLDEPCPAVNLGAARKISDENVTPIGWGRNATSITVIQELLREQMLDVVRLDIGRHGISSIRKAAALAETYYVAVAPYHRGGPIATAAALHLAASLPNFFIQQIPWTSGDEAKARAEIVGGEIEKVKDGFLALPTGPGLGIKVNESALRRYAA